jgi:hypothetical protein
VTGILRQAPLLRTCCPFWRANLVRGWRVATPFAPRELRAETPNSDVAPWKRRKVTLLKIAYDNVENGYEHRRPPPRACPSLQILKTLARFAQSEAKVWNRRCTASAHRTTGSFSATSAIPSKSRASGIGARLTAERRRFIVRHVPPTPRTRCFSSPPLAPACFKLSLRTVPFGAAFARTWGSGLAPSPVSASSDSANILKTNDRRLDAHLG